MQGELKMNKKEEDENNYSKKKKLKEDRGMDQALVRVLITRV